MQEGREWDWVTSLLHALCNMKDITITLSGSKRVLIAYPATKVLKSIMLSRRAGGAVAACSRVGYKSVTLPL